MRNSSPPPFANRVVARLLTAMGASAVVILLVLSGITWRADTALYDLLVQRSAHAADERILVVAVDEKSLAELGRWPWSRRVHAQLIDALSASGAKSIALDILLSEPALYDPEGDALLTQALTRSHKVVLPVFAEPQQQNGPLVELLPIPEFAASAAALGHVDMALDSDGVARSMFLRAGLGTPHWPSLALALHQLGNEPGESDGNLPGLRNPQAGTVAPQDWVRDHEVLVPYVNPPHGFKRVSYSDVLNDRVPAAQLKDRWILVGVTAAGMGGDVATPGWHANAPRLSGVDYQANALNMLLQDSAIVPLSTVVQSLLSIFLVVLPLLIYGLPGFRKISTPIVLALLAVPLVTLLLLWQGYWFAPLSAWVVLCIGTGMRLVRVVRRTQRRAQSDPLTGLANRHRFDEALALELRSAQRSGQPLSLLLLDVDHFKGLNDSQGHPTGDKVLRTLSGVLRDRARRPRDLVARLGGDEFAILLPETSSQAAAAIATTVHVDLANLAAQNNAASPAFTISVGIHTTRQGETTTATEVFERTDAALYQAKQAGRNRSATFGEETALPA